MIKRLTRNLTSMTIVVLTALTITGCSKQSDWLDVKEENGDITPEKIEDYQAILDNNNVFNDRYINIGLISTDNLYINDDNLQSLAGIEREAYLWTDRVWESLSGESNDWKFQFNIIAYSNIVLDGLAKFDPNIPMVKNIKGQALFYRAFAYYNLSQLFCMPYDKNTAGTELGLPLRTDLEVTKVYPRLSLQETYDLILSDLAEATALLDNVPAYTRRPSKYAACGLLAKTYLVTDEFQKAEEFADKAMSGFASLLDFNSDKISTGTTYRFPIDLENPEILFFGQAPAVPSLTAATSNKAFVDSVLFNSYEDSDLRKTYFYAKSGAAFKFRGGYTGNRGNFCGIAINEMYFIKAECQARRGALPEAVQTLNALLKMRYASGAFVERTPGTQLETLAMILQERRKELPFTGMVRWEDLRRLNKDDLFKKTLTRVTATGTHTLDPGSRAYAFPIPEYEIALSGIAQNPR